VRLRNDIVLRPASPDTAGRRRSQLLLSGTEAPFYVVGEELGAAVELDRRLVLLVLYGDPYEESLQIYMIDDSYRVLDRATLGAMGASGVLQDLQLESPSAITFRFFRNRRWRLRAFTRPHIANPFSALALGVWRPLQLRRWFTVGPAR
jgi:hypothetical protein